jgi:lipoprotein signal peptidase
LAAAAFHRTGPGYLDITGVLALAFTTRLSYRLALSAILGGALGNVADRLRLGYVEDFLDFHYAQWHWPSFNLADVWIFLGVALYLGGNTTSTRQPPPLNRPASSLSHA